jgi:5-methylcytosine-specific restriction endonuclease McrA
MKFTKKKLLELIKESLLKEMGPAFPIGILDDAQHLEKRGLDLEKGFQLMIDDQLGNIGLSKMILKYLLPHKDKLRLDIFWSDDNITVSFSYDGIEIGETSAMNYETDVGQEFFVVTWGGSLAGDMAKNKPRYNSIDKVFKSSGYGPITYEIAIEYLSIQGLGLTSDRESVSSDAYGLWEYYYNNRPDVQKIPIDFNEKETGLGQYSPLTISSEKWYSDLTKKLPDKQSLLYIDDSHDTQPLTTDRDLQRQFVDYLKNESPLMQAYSKKDRPFLASVRDLGILYINNDKVEPEQEIEFIHENIDYKKAYKKYHSSKKAKKARAQRNRIGRLIKKFGIEIPDGYEIDHITPIDLGGSNDINNIRIIPRKKNRSRGQKITTRKRKKNGTY